MATFTMYLHEVIESLYGTSIDPDDYEQEYESVTFDGMTYGKLPVLPQYNDLGLGYYPLFDENYRKILNGKIIDEYWNQEIGTETIDNFTLILRKKMDQIMPFYNQLYKSQQLEFDPLKTMDIQSIGQTTMEGSDTASATSENGSTSKSGSRATNLNFPQTALAGNADYATSAIDTTSNNEVDAISNQETESTSTNETNSDNRVTGYQAVPANLIMAYRDSLINVDTMVIDELKDCFMLLNNNGDEYFASESRYGVY